jgi:hypothetical protein
MAFELALGYNRGGRILTDRRFADRILADRVLADWGALDNRLWMREIRSDRRADKSQRSSPNDHEFQHRSLLLSLMMQKIT